MGRGVEGGGGDPARDPAVAQPAVTVRISC